MTTVTAPAKPAQLRITRRSPAYWRVTIDNPPINVMGPEMVRQFQETIGAIGCSGGTDSKDEVVSKAGAAVLIAPSPRVDRNAASEPRPSEVHMSLSLLTDGDENAFAWRTPPGVPRRHSCRCLILQSYFQGSGQLRRFHAHLIVH